MSGCINTLDVSDTADGNWRVLLACNECFLGVLPLFWPGTRAGDVKPHATECLFKFVQWSSGINNTALRTVLFSRECYG